MRYARAITLLSLTVLLAATPLAEAKTPRPYVKSVTPLRASVGEKMTIQGFYFTPGYAENMVVLVRRDGRVSYVRSEHSTKSEMTIILPKKLERLLKVVDGVRVPTGFRIKVIARRMSRLAKGALSQPMIGPDVAGDCDKDGIPNETDLDDDNDLLPDAIERRARTNPCVADSDGDKLLDGWEYMSAIDLNRNALPYPGKRPYRNALYADALEDFDGDGLWAWAEHHLWTLGGRKYPLNYSDGDQYTDPLPTGYATWNDFDSDGKQSDDERDFDSDGLANVYELRLSQFQPWDPWFPGIVRPNFVERDTDGDGVLDGADDQDHDDRSNVDELIAGTWAMNPCDPSPVSRTCPRWLAEVPQKPQELCLSRTLRTGSVKWFDYQLPEEHTPGEPAPEESATFC